MKSLKNIINKIFLYNEPIDNYNFSLSEDTTKEKSENSNTQNTKSIYNNLNINIEYIKVKFNALINSDIIIREFNLIAKGKEYKASLVFIDGMVKTDIINNFILRPLMSNKTTSPKATSSVIANNITVKKIKKFNLENYIYNSLVPQNSIDKVKNFEDFISAINTGECGLLVDTLNIRLYIRCKRIRI